MPSASSAAPQTELPLAFNQEKRLLLEEWARARSISYIPFTIPLILDFRGAFNLPALIAALKALVRRHAVLRTAFVPSRCKPAVERQARLDAFATTGIFMAGLYKQVILPEAELRPDIRALASSGEDAVHSEIESIAVAALSDDFEFAQPPLMRATVLGIGARHFLIIVIHHLVADLWSLKILREEVTRLYAYYQGAGSYPPLPSGTYADFVASQHARLNSAAFEGAIEFWRQQFSAFASAHLYFRDFPFASPPPAQQGFQCERQTLRINPGRAERLRAFARQFRVTSYVLFLAGLTTLLHRCTGKPAVAVWGNFLNRSRETERLIGWFANTHFMAIDYSDDPAVDQLLRRVRGVVFQALDHQEIPLAALWPALQPLPQGSDMKILFDFVGREFETEIGEPRPDLSIEELELPSIFMRAHVGLAILVRDTGGTIAIEATYSADRFSRPDICGLLAYFDSVLTRFMKSPETRTSEIAVLRQRDKQALRSPDARSGPRECDAWALGSYADWGS
jgi:hypothetical protein